MATKTLTQIFNEVAEAIQAKKGSSTPISAEDFGTEIANLPSGGGGDTNALLWDRLDYRLMLHLDKLKQYLPTEILNLQLSYYTYSEGSTTLGVTIDGDTFGPICIPFALDIENKKSSHYSHYCNYFIAINTDDCNIENDHISVKLDFKNANKISDVEVFDGMTISGLIDNMITANGSAIYEIFDLSSEIDENAIIPTPVRVYGEYSTGEIANYSTNKSIANNNLKDIFTVEPWE